MPTEKFSRIDTIPEAFLKKIPASEREVYDDVIGLLARLEVRNGSFVISDKNLKIASQISAMLRNVLLASSYVEAVTEFAREFDVQKDVNNKLFSSLFPEFTQTEMMNSVMNLSKRNTIDLLLNRASDTDFVAPLRDVIEQAVISGSGFKETLTTIRDFIEGSDGKDGALLRYSTTYAHDAFAIADRSYTSIVSEEIKAEWFFYSGGKITTTRPFCLARYNEYYHKKEVQAWGYLGDWNGKIPGTDPSTIFSYAGGYNCGHSILPQSIFNIPKDVIERNIANGNFTPNQFERDELGL